MLNEPSALVSPVQIVTESDGSAFEPAFWTPSTRSVRLEMCWRLGKLARVTLTGKFPVGSVTSWRVPPPHAESVAPTATSATTVPFPAGARTRGAAALVPISPKARGTYHPLRPPHDGSNWPRSQPLIERLWVAERRTIEYISCVRGDAGAPGSAPGRSRWSEPLPIGHSFPPRACTSRSETWSS